MFVITDNLKISKRWECDLRKNEWCMLNLPHFWTVIEIHFLSFKFIVLGEAGWVGRIYFVFFGILILGNRC